MAGYLDTKKLIIDTLMGRPAGTQIMPEDHQTFALSLLDYIHSVELIGAGTLQGIATTSTVPVQPDDAKVSYMATVPPGQTYTFTNFYDQGGNAISVTTGNNTMSLLILLWNGEYWQVQNNQIQLAIDYTDGFLFKGVASPSMSFDTPDQNVFYIGEAGTYPNYGEEGLTVPDGKIVVFKYNGSWSYTIIFVTDVVTISEEDQTIEINGEEKGALGGVYIEDPEWTCVATDKNYVILFGVKSDGNFYFGKGCPPQIQALLADKVDKVTGKSLIDSIFAGNMPEILQAIDNAEWMEVVTNEEGVIIEGTQKDGYGTKKFNVPVKFRSATGTILNLAKLNLTPQGIEDLKEDMNVAAARFIGDPDTTVDFQIAVNVIVTLQSDDDNAQTMLDSQTLQNDNCKLMLPSNYSRTGKPVPLIIMPHGGGGTCNDITTNTLSKYFCANGFAIADCDGIPAAWRSSNSTGTSHCANPMAMECYNKLYQYITEKYNVEHDVILVGGSMGGMTSIQIAQLGNIPVKAIGVNCPVTDLYNQAWMHSWSNPFPADDIVRTIGVIYGFYHLDSGINDKFVWDAEKTIGYNPILNGMITMDAEGKIIPSDGCYMVAGNTYWQAVEYGASNSYIQMNHAYSVNDVVNIPGYMYNSFKCIQGVTTVESDKTTYPQYVLATFPEGSHYWKAIKFDGSAPNIEMNHSYAKATSTNDVVVNVPGYNYHSFRCIEPVTTLESDPSTQPILATDGKMVKEYHKFPYPIKIWHCKDDSTVGYYSTERLVNAIRNGGGAAILRPIATGGHGPMNMGGQVANPIGNNVFRGTTLDIRGMMEEVYIWINRFVRH